MGSVLRGGRLEVQLQEEVSLSWPVVPIEVFRRIKVKEAPQLLLAGVLLLPGLDRCRGRFP